MSRCPGELAVTTKVDQQMIGYIDSEAERIGVNRAEFVRRLFDFYQMSRREELGCPHCGETVQIDLES